MLGQLFVVFFDFWRGSFGGGLLGTFGLQLLRSLQASLEAIDAAGSVDKFLFAGEEGMASGTNFHFDLFSGRASQKSSAASTSGGDIFVVGWVNFFFHEKIAKY